MANWTPRDGLVNLFTNVASTHGNPDLKAGINEIDRLNAEISALRAHAGQDGWHLIYFEDAGVGPEIFDNEESARARYEQISFSYNAHLFRKVDSNAAAPAVREAQPEQHEVCHDCGTETGNHSDDCPETASKLADELEKAWNDHPSFMESRLHKAIKESIPALRAQPNEGFGGIVDAFDQLPNDIAEDVEHLGRLIRAYAKRLDRLALLKKAAEGIHYKGWSDGGPAPIPPVKPEETPLGRAVRIARGNSGPPKEPTTFAAPLPPASGDEALRLAIIAKLLERCRTPGCDFNESMLLRRCIEDIRGVEPPCPHGRFNWRACVKCTRWRRSLLPDAKPEWKS